MLKQFTVVYIYANPALGCAARTDSIMVKATDKNHAKGKAFKKKKPGNYFVSVKVYYSGPPFISRGLDIFKMPQEQHVATAVSHKAKRTLLKLLDLGLHSSTTWEP